MRKVGVCNFCGECCGSKKANGEQNNAVPTDWPEALETFSLEAAMQEPFIRVFGLPGRGGAREGSITVDGKEFQYKWVKDHGLCHSDTDFACPFLTHDRTRHKCGIYGTSLHWLWETYCNTFIGENMTKFTADSIKKNCPSCSIHYEED